jgi:hypothetical protein
LGREPTTEEVLNHIEAKRQTTTKNNPYPQ